MSKEVVHQAVEKIHSKEDGLNGGQVLKGILSMGIGLLEEPKDRYEATLVHPDGSTTSAKGDTESEAVASAYSKIG